MCLRAGKVAGGGAAAEEEEELARVVPQLDRGLRCDGHGVRGSRQPYRECAMIQTL